MEYLMKYIRPGSIEITTVSNFIVFAFLYFYGMSPEKIE